MNENIKIKIISFQKWLKGFVVIKISNNKKELKLFPRWLLLTIISLCYAYQFVGLESLFFVFTEFLMIFFGIGLLWYCLKYLYH